MKIKLVLNLVLLITISFGCSSLKETEKNTTPNKEEVYIFDDVSDLDTTSDENVELTFAEDIEQDSIDTVQIVPPTEYIPQIFYTVQIGAFSTQVKADKFIESSRKKIQYQLKTHFNQNLRLYVVQLPLFNTRIEAEKVRNELWMRPEFSDAFIVIK